MRVEQNFDVPPEAEFDTRVEPELMRTWWGNDAEFEINLRTGGERQIVRFEPCERYLAKGYYLEVDRPSALRNIFGMPQFSPEAETISITIEEYRVEVLSFSSI